jgi:hypothetical protein
MLDRPIPLPEPDQAEEVVVLPSRLKAAVQALPEAVQVPPEAVQALPEAVAAAVEVEVFLLLLPPVVGAEAEGDPLPRCFKALSHWFALPKSST